MEDKIMRRFILPVLTLMLFTLLLGLTSSSQAEQKRVVVMWVGKASMANEVFLGFIQKQKELAPDLVVVLKRELPDMKEAERLFREYEETMSGIIFLRSSGAEFLGKAHPKIPCFVGGTNNPQELGVIKDLRAPEGNVTGVTYDIPDAKRFQVIKTLFPNTKSLALVTEKGHPGGIIDQKGTSEECKRLGIKYHDVSGATVGELVEGMRKLVGNVDLFILANNKLVLDNTTNFAKVSQDAKIPMFAYSERPVHNGAAAGLVARNDFLGSLLAETVVDVIVKGKPIAQVPVKTDPQPQIMINETTAKALGISFPTSVMSTAKIVK
jgi:putative tryptophan/tyrosine transport system substrate-binding protein